MNRKTKLTRITVQPGDSVIVEQTSILRSVKIKHNRQGGAAGRAVLVFETPVTAMIQIDKSGRRRQH